MNKAQQFWAAVGSKDMQSEMERIRNIKVKTKYDLEAIEKARIKRERKALSKSKL